MLLHSLLLLLSASLLVPATQSFFLLLIRPQNVVSVKPFFARPVKENRAFRRRLARSQKRIRPSASAHSPSLGTDRTSAFSVDKGIDETKSTTFYSVIHFLGAASCTAAWNRCRELILPGTTARGVTSTCEPTTKIALYRQEDASDTTAEGAAFQQKQQTPAPLEPVGGVSTYVRYLLIWVGKYGGTILATIVNLGFGPQHSPASAASPSTAAVKRKGGNSKGNGKGVEKKRRTHGDDAGDGDEEQQEGNGGKPNGHDHEDDKKKQDGYYWACPFYKLKPRRYYRCLRKFNFERFSDVIQHINRCHVLEGNTYCPKCLTKWPPEKLEQCNAHVQAGACQDTTEAARLYRPTYDRIKEELTKLKVDYDKWFMMWRMLFPGETQPWSPFVKNSIDEPMAEVLREPESAAALQDGLPVLFQRFGILVNEYTLPRLASGILELVLSASIRPSQHSGRYLDRESSSGGNPGTEVATNPLSDQMMSYEATPSVGTRHTLFSNPPALLVETSIFGSTQIPITHYSDDNLDRRFLHPLQQPPETRYPLAQRHQSPSVATRTHLNFDVDPQLSPAQPVPSDATTARPQDIMHLSQTEGFPFPEFVNSEFSNFAGSSSDAHSLSITNPDTMMASGPAPPYWPEGTVPPSVLLVNGAGNNLQTFRIPQITAATQASSTDSRPTSTSAPQLCKDRTN